MSNQYRLLSGQHLHTDGRIYEAGQIVVSSVPLDLIFKDEVRPRFENVAGTTDRFNQIWDPRTETIEQFSHRMRDLVPPKPPGGDALVFDPKVETLDQFYHRTSKKMGLNQSIPEGSQESPEKKGHGQPPALTTHQPTSRTPSQVTSSPVPSPQGSAPGGSITSAATVKTDAQLNAMSLQDLQRWAEDEEMDLGHAKTKPEIVKAIKAHQGSN